MNLLAMIARNLLLRPLCSAPDKFKVAFFVTASDEMLPLGTPSPLWSWPPSLLHCSRRGSRPFPCMDHSLDQRASQSCCLRTVRHHPLRGCSCDRPATTQA